MEGKKNKSRKTKKTLNQHKNRTRHSKKHKKKKSTKTHKTHLDFKKTTSTLTSFKFFSQLPVELKSAVVHHLHLLAMDDGLQYKDIIHMDYKALHEFRCGLTYKLKR